MEKKDLKGYLNKYMANGAYYIENRQGKLITSPDSADGGFEWADVPPNNSDEWDDIDFPGERDIEYTLDILNKYKNEPKFYQVLTVSMDYDFSQLWFYVGGKSIPWKNNYEGMYEWGIKNRKDFIVLNGCEY